MVMFEEGNILYFNPFYFENGNMPKPKYFLVLKALEDEVVLASLPTSHDHIPSYMDKVHGCIDDDAINFNCYYFQGGINVAYNDNLQHDFAFPRDTYVYGYRINLFDLNKFRLQISDGLNAVTIVGKLYRQEMLDIKDCLKKSTSVKKKFRNLL